MTMKKQLFTLFLTLCVLLSLCACAQPVKTLWSDPEGQLRLAAEAVTPYQIVVSQSASADIRTIAEEFAGYFEKITGAKPIIVTDAAEPAEREIVIGKTARAISSLVDHASLGEEQLIYRTDGKSLTLTGGSDRAVAYAVYGFLENCAGVRYLSPTYELIPPHTIFDIPADLSFSDRPVFWFRSMNEAGANDEKWMVKMRLNSRESLGSERFRRDPFVGGGHGYADWFVHTIGKLADMKQDYPNRDSFMNLQPCLTSEETYQSVLKNVRAWLNTYTNATIVSISQNDGTNVSAMCTCDNCQKIYADYGQTQSAKWIWFVSKVANELKDEYPNVYFDTLAYNFTLRAPTGLTIPDNVIVRLAPAHACLNHSYKECGLHFSASAASQVSSEFSVAMDDWSKIAPHRFVWDYDALFYNYLAPFTNFHYIRENIRNYAIDGIEGVFLQGDSTGSGGFSELRAYLVAKCLWNPYMTEETYEDLMCEFMENYYGQGTSEPLMEFIDFFNGKLEDKHYTLYAYTHELLPVDTTTDENGVIHLDTAPLIDPMNAFFDRAEEHVTNEKQLLHLRKARMQAKYYEVMARFWIQYEGENVEIDYEYRKKLNSSLYEDAIACGIQQLSEGQVLTTAPNLNYAPLYWDRK